MNSTHTANLHLPNLPTTASEAHIFPTLASGSLISIGQLCDHGCTAHFSATDVTIHYHDKIVLRGTRSLHTKLWTLQMPNTPLTLPPVIPDSANALVHNPTIAARIEFYHSALFSPALTTWCTALDAGHFTTWPELTSAQVRRYPLNPFPWSKAI